MPGVAEWNRLLFEHSQLLDAAHVEFETRIRAAAAADDEFLRAHARAMTRQKGEKGTVPEKVAIANLETAELKYAAELADGLRMAAKEAVQSRRQQLSAVQSLVSLAKSEADLAKWGPSEGSAA